MDKKNTTIGVLFLIAAVAVLFFTPRQAPKAPASPIPPPADTSGGPEAALSERAPASELPASAPTSASAAQAAPVEPPGLFAPVEMPREGEQFVSLANDFIEVRFTNFGGAIAEVVLKQYRAHKDSPAGEHYVLNELHASPALALLGFAGADRNTAYTLVSRTTDRVIWRATIPGQVEITRQYWFGRDERAGDNPYLLRHETTFRNLGGAPTMLPSLVLNLGTAAPASLTDPGLNLKVGAYSGDGTRFVTRDQFVPGWISRTVFGNTEIRREFPIEMTHVVWAAVKNQFFVTLLLPDQPGTGVAAQRVEFPLVAGEPQPRVGLTANFTLPGPRLDAGAAQTLGFNFYAGPKEYDRLRAMKMADGSNARMDRVMEFGWFVFEFFAVLLLKLMKALHGLMAGLGWAWGFAIIGTTLIIRTLMWPLTASAARSAKRMAKIQGPIRELQEKYKDNRAKLNEEMLKLWKENKINPVGGCLPIFVQLPVFFGLFSMLRSASELRFADFLWIGDLSAPDTIAHVPGLGFPINIMPLLMGVSMVLQMRMTPTPTTDNASARMMKFMPYVVTALCYNFSSGLAVYWTASNLFSVFQQWVTNRRKDPVETTPAPQALAGAKRVSAALPAERKKKK